MGYSSITYVGESSRVISSATGPSGLPAIQSDTLFSPRVFYWALLYYIVKSIKPSLSFDDKSSPYNQRSSFVSSFASYPGYFTQYRLSSLRKWILEYADPTFAILFTLGYQTYALINILIYVRPISRFPQVLAKFALITVLFKLIPLYAVWTHKVNWLHSINAWAVMFLIYYMYIRQRGLYVFEIYNDLTNSYIADDNRLESYRWIQKLTFS